MKQTPTQILAVLNSVGKAPVSIPFSTTLFSEQTLRTAAAGVGAKVLSIQDGGDLTINAIGEPAWQALREFSTALLSASLREQ